MGDGAHHRVASRQRAAVALDAVGAGVVRSNAQASRHAISAEERAGSLGCPDGPGKVLKAIVNRADAFSSATTPCTTSAFQEEHLSGAKHARLTLGRDLDPTFNALDRDLTRHLVRRQGFARKQHEAYDLQVFRLEQRGRPGAFQTRTKRPHVDGFACRGVSDGHARVCAEGLAFNAGSTPRVGPTGGAATTLGIARRPCARQLDTIPA